MKNNNLKLKINFKFLALIFIFVFFFFNLSDARAALLYLDPNNGDYGAGDTFIVKMRIDNEDECINAVDVRLSFPSNLLRITDFSRGDSILTLWIKEPVIDNKNGIISFSGGIPAGYCGRIKGDPALSNILGRAVFTVSSDIRNYDVGQTANIEILGDAQVFINDGSGTQADVTVRGAQFIVHPEPFTLKNEWLEELKEDEILPEPFKIIIQRNKEVYNGRYYIIFSTTDKQSGLDYFEIFENNIWKRAESPYLLKNRILPKEIKLRALDKAGNERMGEYTAEEVPLPYSGRNKAIYLIILIVTGILTAVILYLKNMRDKNNNNDDKISS